MDKIINPYGKKITSVETEFCGQKLSLEVNRVGFRTTSSVIATYGDTVVLGTVMISEKSVQGFDYFPLSIDYEEKFYAAGKISGSRYIKREGRPSDEAILIGRLIDRPIRPLWPKGYRHEVQGIATVLSMDPNFRPDMIAMIAVSAAFMLSGAPFDGPVAGIRVGLDENNQLAGFLSSEQLDKGGLDLVVAGTSEGVMMVEAGASEVSEMQVVRAIEYAQKLMQPAIDLQNKLVSLVKPTKQEYELVLPDASIQSSVDKWLAGRLGKNLRTHYPERNQLIQSLRDSMHQELTAKIDNYQEVQQDYDDAFTLAMHKDVREGIIKDQSRPDGRKLNEIRPLSSQVGFLPRAHGSSIFTRGITQAMNIVTLAPLSYSQMVDTMEQSGEKRYMHHYNAPGWTVGEVRRLGSPGRREIGHSYLAERALVPVIPDSSTFPYAIRSVTEIMSQNGSTSMAATCASCLALMDAGVPLKAPVSGIAMGLILDGNKPYILSDIADAEDFAGDMDFKVTGTTKGITALQMDMKVHGLDVGVLAQALEQAKEGRAFILQHMLLTLPSSRGELSKYAPRVESIKINPDKIREVIGKGGEIIQKITSETNTEIDIDDDGTIRISSPDLTSIDQAKAWILDITAEPELGHIYVNVPVVSVMDFGAFVQILPGKDGLVHVSEISNERVSKPSDVLKVGDKVSVKLIAIDEKGRLQLSMKAVPKKT